MIVTLDYDFKNSGGPVCANLRIAGLSTKQNKDHPPSSERSPGYLKTAISGGSEVVNPGG